MTALSIKHYRKEVVSQVVDQALGKAVQQASNRGNRIH